MGKELKTYREADAFFEAEVAETQPADWSGEVYRRTLIRDRDLKWTCKLLSSEDSRLGGSLHEHYPDGDGRLVMNYLEPRSKTWEELLTEFKAYRAAEMLKNA